MTEDFHSKAEKIFHRKASKRQKFLEKGRHYIWVNKKTKLLVREGETDEEARQRYLEYKKGKK